MIKEKKLMDGAFQLSTLRLCLVTFHNFLENCLFAHHKYVPL